MANLDADLENADWPKRTWDLGIDNIEDLREFLRVNDWDPEDFKKLPVYRWNVEKISWLAEL
jgi:hypothetical protein